MKKIIIVFTCISVIYFGTVFYTVNKNYNKEKILYERIVDTVYVHVRDSTSVAQIDSLYSVIDSLEQINSDYFTELTIATIKLERIKDYNKIAAKGNNIKYIRCWINRVLNE